VDDLLAVLREALTNVARHAGARSADVDVTVTGGRLTLRVTDDGPGIPADLLPNVFERFAKSPTSRGSGLGLAIARAIVEAHGGTIGAESIPAPASGHGTTVTITLPAGPPFDAMAER
jgi:two-component system sensor histidine kinase KdpD